MSRRWDVFRVPELLEVVPTSRDTHSNHQMRNRNKQTRLRSTQLQKLSAEAVVLSIMSSTLTNVALKGIVTVISSL